VEAERLRTDLIEQFLARFGGFEGGLWQAAGDDGKEKRIAISQFITVV
jgi:hypothetical protein